MLGLMERKECSETPEKLYVTFLSWTTAKGVGFAGFLVNSCNTGLVLWF